jgi:hypothetical protein
VGPSENGASISKCHQVERKGQQTLPPRQPDNKSRLPVCNRVWKCVYGFHVLIVSREQGGTWRAVKKN